MATDNALEEAKKLLARCASACADYGQDVVIGGHMALILYRLRDDLLVVSRHSPPARSTLERVEGLLEIPLDQITATELRREARLRCLASVHPAWKPAPVSHDPRVLGSGRRDPHQGVHRHSGRRRPRGPHA